jgi:hypothetical protein
MVGWVIFCDAIDLLSEEYYDEDDYDEDEDEVFLLSSDELNSDSSNDDFDESFDVDDDDDSCSVGDHRPVGRDRIRSRPKNLKTGRDPEKNSGHDP